MIAPRFNIDFILRGTESEIVDASPAETDEYMFYGLGLTKSFTQSLNWTTTTGLKVQENPAGKNDHSADIDNRLTLRAWDAYEFLLSHRWRERVRNSSNPSEGSRENLIIFQVNRSL